MQTSQHNLTTEVNGITISYDDFKSDLIPIIFIHGFPFNKSSWQPQVDFLKKTNRVIAYDIRGFGNSSADETEFSMDLFADDLILFMDKLEISKAIVCGLSMGGYILLNAINRYPERFAAIVLCDTQCIADSPEAKEKRYKTMEQINENGLHDFVQNFIAAVFYKAPLKLVDDMKNGMLTTSPKTIVKTLKALTLRKDMQFSLQKIAVPTLVLCGTQDVVTPLTQSQFLVEHIPNATLKSIDCAGHLSNLEQPDEFNRHLFRFISKVESEAFAYTLEKV